MTCLADESESTSSHPQVLSHNHYDHQDNLTLSALFKRFAARPPLVLVPLNNARSLPSDVPRDRVVEMDWWEEREVAVAGKGRVKMTCSESVVSPGIRQTCGGMLGGRESLGDGAGQRCCCWVPPSGRGGGTIP
jgi:L-ascorbate metabolism protein UlaG (beta-lactamase superfamily)